MAIGTVKTEGDRGIPFGFCHCGCGQKTNRIRFNNAKRGYVRGEPHLYVLNHRKRRSPVDFVEEESGCWSWHLALFPNGYGKKKLNGRSQLAHRAMYEELIGPIPNDLQLDHLCRNRACVNPGHLEPVTGSENLRRGLKPGGKLGNAAVREIRALCAAGWRQLDIANAYGISQTQVSTIHRRAAWGYIHD